MALGLSMDDIYDCVSSAVLGMLIGGRLGYSLFYNFSYYLEYPLKLFAIWEGGMSYHGGAIGAALGIIYFCLKSNRPYLPILDLLSISTCFGVGLGRIANFINGELYGRVTSLPWGMVFRMVVWNQDTHHNFMKRFLKGFLCLLFYTLF